MNLFGIGGVGFPQIVTGRPVAHWRDARHADQTCQYVFLTYAMFIRRGLASDAFRRNRTD